MKTTNEHLGLSLMGSYGAGKFLAEFLSGAFTALVFKFYETEVQLSAGLVAIAMILFSIWNAVNDPLVGFFTSRPTVFTARYGRRFPWILAGTLGASLTFIPVFSPPASLSQAGLFVWLLVTICLFDALYSMWEVNYQSIFPDRFRDATLRAKAAGIATLVGVLGVAGGAVLPSFFIRYGNIASYMKNAWIVAGISLLASVALMPSCRETRAMIDRYIKQEKERKDAPSFWGLLRQALRQRNFLAFILLYFFYQSATISMSASIYYVGDYILGGKPTTLIFAGMLTGSLLGVPLWLGLGKKIKSRQTLLVLSASTLAVFCVPLLFAQNYYSFIAAMFAWGLSFGGVWMLITPAMADVIDEIVAQTGLRDDGVYLGFRAFAGRLAYAVQAISFWLVHALTGFAADPRSSLALRGIRIHTALVPAVLLLVGVIVFLRLNTLNAASAEANRKKLQAKGL